MRFAYQGACQCGAVELTIQLPQPLSAYSPRCCDCHFCEQHKIAYLSDPDGILLLKSHSELTIRKQGSQQADFLMCPICMDVLAASYQIKQRRIGALNARLLEMSDELQPQHNVSPKQLSDDEKRQRWQQMWLPISVEITS